MKQCKDCAHHKTCMTLNQFRQIAREKSDMYVGGHLHRHKFPRKLEQALASCCKFWEQK